MSPSPSTFKVLGLILAAMLIGGLLFAQAEAPGDAELSSPSDQDVAAEVPEAPPAAASEDEAQQLPALAPAELSPKDDTGNANWRRVIASLTIFVLAVFVGFEVITKVPPTLHTPLMSGANAISGITLVGAVLVAANMSFSGFVGFIAVMLATVNAVGGFMVTHRMLAMFKKR